MSHPPKITGNFLSNLTRFTDLTFPREKAGPSRVQIIPVFPCIFWVQHCFFPSKKRHCWRRRFSLVRARFSENQAPTENVSLFQIFFVTFFHFFKNSNFEIFRKISSSFFQSWNLYFFVQTFSKNQKTILEKLWTSISQFVKKAKNRIFVIFDKFWNFWSFFFKFSRFFHFCKSLIRDDLADLKIGPVPNCSFVRSYHNSFISS